MANRYWVGGTDAWDGIAGNKWSATDGGAGGASVPTITDDVFFTNLSSGTCTISTGNTGADSINCTGFTGTITGTAAITVSGSITLVSGMTYTHTGVVSITATATLVTAGKTFSGITIDGVGVTLGDALDTGTQSITLTNGVFNANNYNVTCASFSSNNSNIRTLLMGSGLWTLSGTGTIWNTGTVTNFTFKKDTANILLSDTSTAARTFTGGGLSYNKLTIGGTTGTSTLTISGNNQFTELASTKTVAHTIALGTTVQSFGNWTVTGTAGNVVTLTGTGVTHRIVGACVTGVDYLAMGSIGFSSASPGEFYAGANSTGTAAAPVYRTTKPADSIRYWVGGTGNWSDTARWSDSSGGTGGASLPRSHDDVVFNSASNATAYTVTVNITNRCKSLTIAGPASGNVTLAGTGQIIAHSNITFPATGMTRTWSGNLTLSGSTTGRTITTNGVGLSGSGTDTMTVDGVGCEWSAGSALNLGNNAGLVMNNGSFITNGYSLTTAYINSNNSNTRSLNLGSSSVTISGFTNSINFGTTENNSITFSFDSGTSTIAAAGNFIGNGKTFYNVNLSSTTSNGSVTMSGANTFNNFTVTSPSNFLKTVLFSNDQIINGTLTLGTTNTGRIRMFVRSDTLRTQRTITLNGTLATLNDVDFRDIKAAGTATRPWTGTRLGNCHGNDETSITFTAGTIKYWNRAAGGGWDSTAWATSIGGTASENNFPLAQDTAKIVDTGLNTSATITFTANYAIANIDFSERTTAVNFTTSTYTPNLYGDITLSSAVTLAGTGALTFSSQKTSQNITSAGKTWTQPITVDTSPSSGITLIDSITLGSTLTLTLNSGILNLNNQNATFGSFSSNNSNTRTIAFGTGKITVNGTGAIWATTTVTGLTITGTPVVDVNNNTATSASVNPGVIPEASAISFNFISGTYSLSFLNSSAGSVNNVNFTGFSGTLLGTTTCTIYGNLILSSTMTLTASGNMCTFGSTTTGKTITTNNKTIDFPITFSGIGGSWILQDNLTLGSTRSCTLTNGTLDLNTKTLTTGTTFSILAGTKNITFNGGTIVCPASTTTAFNNSAPTNFTTTAGSAPGIISMTGATAKTFNGNSSTYAAKLRQDGLGTLTINGSNTFTDIQNTVQPTIIAFTSSTTNSFTNAFSLSGTSGNSVSINSTTSGSRATISKPSGIVSVSYCTIKDIQATGGAIWRALTSLGNVNSGNNIGWDFTGLSPALFFSFF